jgi:hypothetical protein
MRRTLETKICDACRETICDACRNAQDDEKTAFPSFRDTPLLNDHFKALQGFLQTTYDYKRSLKSNLDLLGSFPHKEDCREKTDQQRKYIFDKMGEIESYIIWMVVKMYCDMPDDNKNQK